MIQSRGLRPAFRIAILLLLAFFALARTSEAQKGMPADVRAILEKAKAGGEPTDKEEARLEEWAESQRAAAEGVSPGLGASSGGKPKGAEKPAQCPKSGAKPLPATAPGRDEYVKLLQTLVARHGEAAGEARAEVDHALEVTGPAGGSELGALLHAAGAEHASIYASAKAALGVTRDPQLANNLGVALTSEGETGDAARVLLYALTLQPGAALVELNLGWAQFGAGQLGTAEASFRRALLRNSDLAGAEGGLGMVCACRGDIAGAKKYLEASLKRRYSAVFAGAYRMAKRQSQSPADFLPPPQPGPEEPKRIPDLPVSEHREKTKDVRAALQELSARNHQRIDELSQTLNRLLNLIHELDARDAADSGSAMVFRRVFEREIFQFSETVELTLPPRINAVGPNITSSAKVLQAGGEDLAARLQTALTEMKPLQDEASRLTEALYACGDNDACEAPIRKKLNAVERQLKEIAYRLCMSNKSYFELIYAQGYKVYRPYATAVRVGTDDLYAFTDPILERVYAPALNEYLAAAREMYVRAAYQHVLDQAEMLTGNALGSEMECEPPRETEAAEAESPDLPGGKPGDCPLEKPQVIKLVIVTIELGCDKLAVEFGEGLMARVEHTISKDETTIWVGAGVSGGGTFGHVPGNESDSGGDSNILPTKIAPNITLEGKAGATFTFKGNRLVDFGFGTEASGSISVAGASLSGSIQSGVSVEGGLNFGGGGGYQLPGGAGGGVQIP